MTRTIVMLSLFIVTSVSLKGQGDRGYVGLSFGMAVPLGDFGSKKVSDDYAAYANLGTAFDLSTGIKIGEHLGVAGRIRRQRNGLDEQAFADDLGFLFPSFFWTVRAEPYTTTSFLGGLYTSFPLGESFDVDFRTLLGISITSFPELDINGIEIGSGGLDIVSMSSDNASAFTLNIGSSIRYRLAEKVCIFLAIDYWTAAPTFEVVSTSPGFTPLEDNLKQYMSSFNTSIGVGLRL